MINRQNWQDTKEFSAYYIKIGRDVETVKRVRTILRHLLNWADEIPFHQARSIDPAFPTYLLTDRADGQDKQLSAASMKKACEYSRLFFEWIRSEYPTRYKSITKSWIDTLRPGMSKGLHSEYHEHQFFELDQVQKIAALQPANLRDERDQAAVCFMFLSAMRAQAFVSMPTKCVDLSKKTILQFPELGVHTKNGKAEKTQLARIPDLMAIVKAWDDKLREFGTRLWYPRIDRWHRFIAVDDTSNWVSRREILNRGIKHLCELTNVPYLSSHKLRHGHTVYMMRRVKDLKQLKSLSQNLMHSSVAITDGIYGRLVSNDISDMYDELGE